MPDFKTYRGEYFIEREDYLSAANIKFIRKTINKIPVLAVLLAVIVLTITFFADGGAVAYSIVAIFLMIVFFGFYRGAKDYKGYIADGRKKVLRGILTEKKSRYPNDDSDSMLQYFFHVDLRVLKVDLSMYNSYQVGEAIEVHFIGPGPNPQFCFILEHKKISHDKNTW